MVRTGEMRLLPGRYLLVALDAQSVEDPADAALLEKLEKLATPVSLIAGDVRKLTLPIANAGR